MGESRSLGTDEETCARPRSRDWCWSMQQLSYSRTGSLSVSSPRAWTGNTLVPAAILKRETLWKDMSPEKIRKPGKPKWLMFWVILVPAGWTLFYLPHHKAWKYIHKSGLCKAVLFAILLHDNWKTFSPFSENMLWLTAFKKWKQYWISSCSWGGSHSTFHHQGRGTKPQRCNHSVSFLLCSWILNF